MSARSIRRARTREDQKRANRTSAKLAVGAGAALGATVLFAPAAQAATFTVNTLEDSNDGDCFDDDCSLREAADEANVADDADTITFAAGLSGTIELLDGEIEIDAATTITGPGADVLTVSGENTDRILYIDASDTGQTYDPVTITGLTLANGDATGEGGALYAFNTTLTLDGMAFVNNTASSSGGAVSTDNGNLFISNSRFTGNAAGSWGGALYLEDTEATPEDDVEFRVTNSFFSGNDADGNGGAIDIDDADGDSVIEGTTVVGNTATSGGGGITNNGTIDGDITIRNSTIANNTAGNYGGGFYTGAVDGALLIENSTISGNRADQHGGGIDFGVFDAEQTATVRNSTVTGNTAGVDGAFGGGGIYIQDATDNPDDNGPVEVSSTIVANNTADFGPDLGQGEFAEGINLAFSLIENPADAPITATGPNVTGVDPQLGPLQNNGGATDTHAPAFTSPALDMGVGNGLGTDQRGAPRTFDAANVANAAGGDGTDIGAVELLPGGKLSLAECKGATENVLFAPGAEIVGSSANDVVVGTDAKDVVKTAGGKDLVCANGGNDNVRAGGGKDRAFGGAGKDKLSGQGGKDKLSGNAGKDTLKGGGGADKLKGGGGKDKLRGGPGKDRLSGGGGKDSEVQ